MHLSTHQIGRVLTLLLMSRVSLVAQQLQPPTALSPNGPSPTHPLFQWTPVAGATYYHLSIVMPTQIICQAGGRRLRLEWRPNQFIGLFKRGMFFQPACAVQTGFQDGKGPETRNPETGRQVVLIPGDANPMLSTIPALRRPRACEGGVKNTGDLYKVHWTVSALSDEPYWKDKVMQYPGESEMSNNLEYSLAEESPAHQ